MPTLSISELNNLYRDAELIDSELFAEQRSNVRLVNGDHYQKKTKDYWNRLRTNNKISTEQKLRVTQNHLHNISKTYTNAILSLAQDSVVAPVNEAELQDQKAADLNSSVWEDIKEKNEYEELRAKFCSDYWDIGEVIAKISFDQDSGEIVGYEQAIDDNGEPMFDVNELTGEETPVQSNNPIKTGAVKIERIFGFNLLRDPAAKSKHESKYLIERYMADIKEVKSWVEGDQEKIDLVQKSTDDTYKVFNGNTGDYSESKDQVMIKEFYYKPGAEYPNGYFYITTPYGILFEGELPFGIFPIVWSGFDDIQTSCRSRSMIKQLRPYQAELNRAISHVVEIQMSNGHDKIFTQAGAKVSPQKWLPGVRAYSVAGQPPTVIQGRTGDQYLPYINHIISQLYRVAKIDDLAADKAQNADAYTMLFTTARQKKVYSLYANRFGRFLNKITEVCLEMAKNYYSPDIVIPMVGKKEIVNIQEFLSTEPNSYRIKIVEGNDDTESVVGKQMAINQLLQYVGGSLSQEDIGKLARNMPYLNDEELFSDLTINYDSAKNVILALDRGEQLILTKYDDHKYMMDKLTLRMRQSDYAYLDPQIQQMYEQRLQQHQEFEVQIQKEIQQAQAGFIPAGGIMVTVDFYVEKDGKQKRLRMPQDSIQWLMEKLEQQGTYLEDISDINQGALGDMAGMLNAGQGQVPAQPVLPEIV